VGIRVREMGGEGFETPDPFRVKEVPKNERESAIFLSKPRLYCPKKRRKEVLFS
jgi:hypothetical protein